MAVRAVRTIMVGSRDSIPIIQTSRKYPHGCGPNAPRTGAAFRWYAHSNEDEDKTKRFSANSKPTHFLQPKNTQVSGSEGDRRRVLEALKSFRKKCKELSATYGEKSRVDTKAFRLVKQNSKILPLNNGKVVGVVPGVEVGDKFRYRAELVILGVHGRMQHGIDYARFKDRFVATCVVSTEGYFDKMGDELLVYAGEGGGGFGGKDRAVDQQMTRGNRALKNSIEVKNDVRVVRGLKLPCSRSGKTTYVYDGLYRVVAWDRSCKDGRLVFEFVLRRKDGQPRIEWKKYV